MLLVPGLWAQHAPPHAMPHPGGGGAPRPAPKRAAPAPKTTAPANPNATNSVANPKDPPIVRLEKMTPEQRQKFFESLPADRRTKVEQQFSNWQKLTPEQRARRLDRLQKFNSLPPEQKQQLRQLSQKIETLPEDRRSAVRKELNRLSNMPDDERNKRLASPGFKKNFSPEEQEILEKSSALLPEPV